MLELCDMLLQAPDSFFVVPLSHTLNSASLLLKLFYLSLHSIYFRVIRPPEKLSFFVKLLQEIKHGLKSLLQPIVLVHESLIHLL